MSKKQKKRFIAKIEPEQCKGCGKCVVSCPQKVLELGEELNAMGYPSVQYLGNCIGCGACFYSCPEPGAITIIEESDNPAKE